MLARQPLSTFTADSATAVGVATSSHAIEKSRRGGENAKQRVVGGGNSRETGHSRDNKGFPTFSAAGQGALEGARDRLSGFLLRRSLLQGGGVGQLTGGGGHL